MYECKDLFSMKSATDIGVIFSFIGTELAFKKGDWKISSEGYFCYPSSQAMLAASTHTVM